jgi:hypothetical protein
MTFPDQQTVDSLDWAWSVARPGRILTSRPAPAGAWTCKHPLTEDVYVGTYTTVQEWNLLANTWTKLCVPANLRTEAWRPWTPNTGTILRLGWATGAVGTAFNAHAINIDGDADRRIVDRPAVGSVVIDSFAAIGSGFVYDPGLKCFAGKWRDAEDHPKRWNRLVRDHLATTARHREWTLRWVRQVSADQCSTSRH